MTQAAVSNIAEAAEQRKKIYKSQSKEARRNLRAAEAEIKRLQVQLGETEAKKDEHHANHKSLAQKHDALHEHKSRLEAEHRVQVKVPSTTAQSWPERRLFPPYTHTYTHTHNTQHTRPFWRHPIFAG